MYVLAIRLLVVGPGALSWRDLGLAQPAVVAVREALTGALLAVPVLVVTLILTALLARFLAPAPNPLPPAGNLGGLLLNLLSAAVLAPIGEELFFRGFATTAWARSIGRNAAIVRGALFFAFAHIVTLFAGSFSTGAQLALYEFVALLPAGLALGWVFLARRSLYASIGLHAAFNAIQVVLLLLVVRVS
jgi:membrane protease YdiL (CAAX protease family)